MSPRMNISFRLAIGLTATTCAAIAIVASDSTDARTSFEPKDAGGGANLPDAAPELEASAPIDASSKPPFDAKDEPVTCTAGKTCAVQLVAGEYHFCARMSDGTVRCWGDNEKGSLGVEDAPKEDPDAGAFASLVTDLTGATDISASGTTTCALVADAGVVCWGGNDKGQLGLTADPDPPSSDEDPHPKPSPVALGAASVKRLDVGQNSSCVVLASGETWCWGDNSQKQLARTTETEITGPGKAELGAMAIARMAIGTNSGFGATPTGDVYSWGALGGPEGSVAARVASISPDVLPLSIGLTSVSSFSVSSTTIVRPSGGGFPRPPPQGVAHACAIVMGDVYCWGVSLMGALGTGLPEPSVKPLKTVVTNEKAWPQQVAAAGDITCVRLTDGSVQCTGDNTFGVLGKDPVTNPFSMFFRPVPSFSGYAVQVAAASRTACALLKDGSVVCWGSNGRGELGRGTIDDEPHPLPVSIRF